MHVWKWTGGYCLISFAYHIRPIWIDIIINVHSCFKHTNKTPSLIYRQFHMDVERAKTSSSEASLKILTSSNCTFQTVAINTCSFPHIDLLQIRDFSWFLTMHWFGHGFINCMASNLLLCPFHKKQIICVKISLVFLPKIICVVLSCIAIEQFNLSIHIKNFWDKIWKLVNLVSYITKRKSLIRNIKNFPTTIVVYKNSEGYGIKPPSMQYCYVIILMHLVLVLSQAVIHIVVTLVSHYQIPQ